MRLLLHRNKQVSLWVSIATLLVPSSILASNDEPPVVRVGSKAFTESVILGELIAHIVEHAGGVAERKGQLGGTKIAFDALLAGEIDVYPEYTGTISEEILAGQGISGMAAIRTALAARGILVSSPLGFNNTYILGMTKQGAERLGVRTISDLRQHKTLRYGFSNEFIARGDGWPSLSAKYRLTAKRVRGLQHDLAYRALLGGDIDVMDLYATDAEIKQYDLFTIEDDLHFFPSYEAVLLYRADLGTRATDIVTALRQLDGRISADDMQAMNARVKVDRVSESTAAGEFLRKSLALTIRQDDDTATSRILRHTWEHIYLVAVSLSAAIMLAIPLGVLASSHPLVGRIILGGVGIVQTIPSLALLVMLVPLLGLGAPPAIAALFVYSLLPIVRNTHAGLTGIPDSIRESAEAIGLRRSAQLWRIELPLASKNILAGIKTSAVINVGTATLGGFIAAGGYGELIFTGLTRNDERLILQGAIPAALMALLVQQSFDLSERFFVPAGLRLARSS